MKKRNSPLRTRHGRSDRERKAWNHFRAIFGTLNQFELNNKKKIQCRILFCFVENSILKPNSVEFGQMHYTASIYISLSECECVAVRSNDGQLVCGWLVLRKSDHFSLVFHIFTWFMHGWLLIWLKFLKLRDYAYVETDETKPRRYPPICVCVCGGPGGLSVSLCVVQFIMSGLCVNVYKLVKIVYYQLFISFSFSRSLSALSFWRCQ